MVDALFEAALGALDGESWLQRNTYYERHVHIKISIYLRSFKFQNLKSENGNQINSRSTTLQFID